MLNRQQIIAIVQKLNFPLQNFWVLTGAALVIYGIKEQTEDIDIGCTRDFFETHCHAYPQQKIWPDGSRSCRIPPHIEVFEEWEVAQIVIRYGLPLASLKDIVCHKRQLGRPKDVRDLALIDAYRQRRSSAS
jgi:hypothetical protein